MMRSALCFILTASALGGLASGRTLHVSPEPLESVTDEDEFRSISDAAAEVRAGDRVLIHSGVYRESVRIEASGERAAPILFESAPAANVVVTGADVVEGWEKDGGGEDVWFVRWAHRFIEESKNMVYPDDGYHRLIGRAEQVFADGYALRQVLSRSEMSRGTFFADTVKRRLYVWLATGRDVDEDVRVEASTRSVIWDCRGDYVEVRGVRFRRAANRAQQGAAEFYGEGNVVEDCIFEGMNSIGAVFLGPGQVVRRCTFQENGQLGWAACGAHGFLFAECITRNNNVKGFQRGWEAGGNKVVLTRDAVIERSQFVGNRGNGLWFDIGNEDCTVRNCLMADNEDAGIFYETSYRLHAHDNVILRNGLVSGGEAWGASAGISISSSPGCVVERNLLVGNQEGVAFREQFRTTPRIDREEAEDPVWNQDEMIRSNLIVYNEAAQIWGWFDVEDERHWPKAMQGKEFASSGLSLEALNIRFENNLYAIHEGQALLHWGVPWRRNASFPTLETVREGLGFDPTGEMEGIVFNNYAGLDLRLSPESRVWKLGVYPNGDVPGVMTGVVGAGESAQ